MQALMIFSADDHIVEPPELFDSLPDRVKPMAPRVVRTDDGDGWVVKPGDNPILVTGGLARKSRVLGNDWWSRTFSFENIDRGRIRSGAAARRHGPGRSRRPRALSTNAS